MEFDAKYLDENCIERINDALENEGGENFMRLQRIFNTYDPTIISFPMDNEYDDYISILLKKLKCGMEVKQVYKIVSESLIYGFWEDDDIKDCAYRIAKEVVEWMYELKSDMP